MRVALCSIIGLVFALSATAQDFKKGVEAYQREDYEAALGRAGAPALPNGDRSPSRARRRRNTTLAKCTATERAWRETTGGP